MMMHVLIKICPAPNRILTMTIMLMQGAAFSRFRIPTMTSFVLCLFGWMNTMTIKKTLEQTTQYARMPNGTILKKHYKSLFSALNVQHRNERATRDTIYSNAPDIDRGETCVQIFVDMETLVTDLYGMKTKKHQQHQNPCKCRYHTLKTMMHTLLDRSGSSGYT
jgi:hypothetical protein